MLRNHAGFIAGKAAALSAAQSAAGAALTAGRAGANQAYTMFGSSVRGIEGHNEKLSHYGKDRTLADNPAVSRRHANEVNTDSQVARKEEWSKGLNEVPAVGGPADLVRKWDMGVASTITGGHYGALTLHQRGDDGARVENVNSANQNATKTPETFIKRTAKRVIEWQRFRFSKARKLLALSSQRMPHLNHRSFKRSLIISRM